MNSIYEDFVAEQLPRLFKFPFQRDVRPDWLVNPKTNHKLELDFYCPQLKIAIEINGIQHYHPDWATSNYQRFKDTIKAKLCKDRGVRLITLTKGNYKKLGGLLKQPIGYGTNKLGFTVKDGYYW